ncbi:MAG: hypothetical protein QOF76_4618 [Solirubrobacteraceae bacterium]|jgi:poly(3-hydroxyalkanoate) depolymerase|nr:hypothetical protein [Solirubrobacteraceae bacterium]
MTVTEGIEYVEAGGVRVRVSRRGEGPPLLLITGIGANIEMWGPFRDALGGFETIAFDAPGVGLSSRTPLPIRMRRLAEIIVELLDALGYDRVDALGYSFGGALVQQLAHDAPDRVGRLVLAGTMSGVGGTVPPGPIVWTHLMTPYRYYSSRYLTAITPGLYGGRSRREPGCVARHETARLSAPPPLLGYLWQIAAIWGWTSVPWLHGIQQATLVLTGDDDPIVRPVNARFLAWRIPNARLHIIPGAGHLFLLDQADDVAPVVGAFLNEKRPPQ